MGANGPDQREDRRRQITWSGVLQTARGPCQCLVNDISSGGARLSLGAAVNTGQHVTLLVTGLGMYRGTVVWAEAGNVGIRFAEDKKASAA
jgi:PilZ domain